MSELSANFGEAADTPVTTASDADFDAFLSGSSVPEAARAAARKAAGDPAIGVTFRHLIDDMLDAAAPFIVAAAVAEERATTGRAVQSRVWQNKIRRGFNTTDVPLEVCLLQGEVAELFDAWRKGGDIAGELADVAIFALSLAEMLGVDLTAAVESKILVNEAREYQTLDNGTHVKVRAALASPGEGE